MADIYARSEFPTILDFLVPGSSSENSIYKYPPSDDLSYGTLNRLRIRGRTRVLEWGSLG